MTSITGNLQQSSDDFEYDCCFTASRAMLHFYICQDPEVEKDVELQFIMYMKYYHHARARRYTNCPKCELSGLAESYCQWCHIQRPNA